MKNSKDKNIPDQSIFESYGYNPNQEFHKENCDCDEDDCVCGCTSSHHHHAKVHTMHGYFDNKTGKRMCELEDGKICNNCGACDMCDLDPTKVCDNCGKCLDEYQTDEKGYVHVPVDKIITNDDDMSVEELYAMYGLDDEDDEDDE